MNPFSLPFVTSESDGKRLLGHGFRLPFSRRHEVDLGTDLRSEQRRVAEAVIRAAAFLVMAEESAERVVEYQCASLTRSAPKIVLAWTWFGSADTKIIRPQVIAGEASRYAEGLSIERTLLTELGPAYRTLSGKRSEPFSISRRSLFGPWRDVARDHHVKSVLALPLVSRVDEKRGLFVLYSTVEDYFEQVGVGIFEALADLFSSVLSTAARNAELKHAANHDQLTGLFNRSAIRYVDSMIRRTAEHDPPCTVVIVDIDHFKRINDDHGHDAGDAVLSRVGQILTENLREADTVIRWGGEEFVVCLSDLDSMGGTSVAQKLRLALERAAFPIGADRTLRLTASFGLTELRLDETLASCVARADVALYVAKEGGRNRVEIAEDATMRSA